MTNLLFTYDSPVGPLSLVSDEDGTHLVGLWMVEQKHRADRIIDSAEPVELDDLDDRAPTLAAATEWLDRYFAGEKPSPAELALNPEGTSFQRTVWSLLQQIPLGEVTTYGELSAEVAGAMGRPSMSSQAVGGAVGRNPISIIVPCHRVVGADGSLTGYAGGLDVKMKLLELEEAGSDTRRTALQS